MPAAAVSPPHSTAPSTPVAAGFELILGDCLAGMRELAADSVGVVVTSPPYNLDIAYGTFRDDAGRGDFLDWCAAWSAEIRRVLRPDGSFFLNLGSAPSDPWLPHELALRLRGLFELQNTLHWIKAITVETRAGAELSVGHFKPINSPRYVTDGHEYVFHFTRSGRVPIDRLAVGTAYADKSNIARWGHTGGADRRCRGNNWFVPYETISSREAQRPHPATFPVALAERCLRLHGVQPGLVALDPFLGIGNAALAARNCAVERFIGFEIDAEYLAEARRRLAEPAATTLPA